MVRLLQEHSSAYKWVAATAGSDNAAGYQLATGDPVMAIGGFNGTDPTPTLAQFQQYVRDGKVHYFISGGRGGGGGFGGNSSGTSSAISSWVSANFTSQTVGGVTVYDLHRG
jgi:4-amino-4-deoxy-L-arabinose transferase-like glycosyltransferase